MPAIRESIWNDIRPHAWKYRQRTRQVDGIIWHATRGNQSYPGEIEMNACINWFKSPNNRIQYAYGDYAGISNYIIGPNRIIEAVPPEYMAAWSSWPSDEHCISVEVAQSNLGQTIERETIDACVEFARWAEKMFGIPRERAVPHISGNDLQWRGHAGHADTVQGKRSGKTDPDAMFWNEFWPRFTEDDMKPEERELLLKIATVLFGHPTGADFMSVDEALLRARQLAMEDAIVLQGLAETQRWVAQHTHQMDGSATWPGKRF